VNGPGELGLASSLREHRGLAPVDDAALPRDVRAAGADARDAYRAALGFEQVLVGVLARSMAQTAGGGEASGAEAAYRDMLPDALASTLTQRGGIGLARQLYDAIQAGARR